LRYGDRHFRDLIPRHAKLLVDGTERDSPHPLNILRIDVQQGHLCAIEKNVFIGLPSVLKAASGMRRSEDPRMPWSLDQAPIDNIERPLHGLPSTVPDVSAPAQFYHPERARIVESIYESTQALLQLTGQLGQMTLENANRAVANQRSSHGPNAKEPKPYDGDRTNGKLDDHIRDVQNWITFYDDRGQWTSESEKIRAAAAYLTGRMHRIFVLQEGTITTMAQYTTWLRETFRDNNEQQVLRENWHATVQGDRSVLDYASDLLYMRAQIVPAKGDEEVKEHFRTGLSGPIQIHLAEHPEWDKLSLNEFIGSAGRAEMIEAAKERARSYGGRDRGRAYAILGAPRCGGRKPSPLTRRPRKGTTEWKDWCRNREACYNCGDTGHVSRTVFGRHTVPPQKFAYTWQGTKA
jgi:Zinc knuckle